MDNDDDKICPFLEPIQTKTATVFKVIIVLLYYYSTNKNNQHYYILQGETRKELVEKYAATKSLTVDAVHLLMICEMIWHV